MIINWIKNLYFALAKIFKSESRPNKNKQKRKTQSYMDKDYKREKNRAKE